MPTLDDTTKTYLSPNEVAKLLMVSPITVRSWAQKGWLVAKVTPGGHRRFLKSDVERFIQESGAIQANAHPKPMRVLIVDDDPIIIDITKYFLEQSGLNLEIQVAQNGFEAGTKIYSFLPDVVLLDLLLPDIDGFRVCSQIKNDPATRHIRVIAITAAASTENIHRILEAGAETYLEKPLNPKVLLELLSQSAN